MIEGYEELEQEVKDYLNTQMVQSVHIKPSEDSPSTVIELESVRITITAVGGHGGVGLQWYKIEDL